MKTANILLLACLLSFSLGCKKILEKEPVDNISIEETFKDFEGAKAALAGAYNSFFNTAYYSAQRSIYPELVGGNVKHSRTANLDLLSEYNLNTTASDSQMNATYTALYGILNNLNYIIQNTPAIAAGTPQTRNRLVAEATALRALVHFDLLQLYAQPYGFTTDASHPGIVINLSPVLVNTTVISRTTVKEGYDAVLADLNSALSLMTNSETVFTAGATCNYINANIINALLARVYLSKGDWQAAYDAANKVIDTRAFTLFSNANYVTSWTLRNTTESIFEVAVPANFAGTSYGNYFTIGSVDLQMGSTEDLLNLYSPTDVRGRTSFYIANTISSRLYYFCKKYATLGSAATGIKLIRLSEIHLIRAEAAAELGNLNQANADLNLIRQRGDAAALPVSLTVKDVLVDAILLERRKELNLEGFLLFDLGRRKKNIVRNDCTALSCGLTYPNARYILPIPEQSVSTNANMVQNPEY